MSGEEREATSGATAVEQGANTGGATGGAAGRGDPEAAARHLDSGPVTHSTSDAPAYQSDNWHGPRNITGNPVGSVSDGPHGSHIEASGGFSPSQLARIDEALTLSSQETGLTYSLYVGTLEQPTRAAAEALFDQLVAGVEAPVLVAVSPGQRVLHIVTGEESGTRLSNRACALAALAMRAAFSSGDLTGGIITGLRMLADSAGRHR